MTTLVSPAVAAGWVLVILIAALALLFVCAAIAAVFGLLAAVRDDPTDGDNDD